MAKANERIKNKFNHRRNYLSWQNALEKSLYSGMIVEFNYYGKDIFDKKPLILLLYREFKDDALVHGLNLNYLSPDMVQNLFCTCELLYKGDSVYSKAPIKRTIQNDMGAYDDTRPNRNLLKEDFTRIMLPTFKVQRGNKVLGLAEAKQQMKVLYEKVIKRLLIKRNIYRTYKLEKMKNIKVIKFKLGAWNQPRLQ